MIFVARRLHILDIIAKISSITTLLLKWEDKKAPLFLCLFLLNTALAASNYTMRHSVTMFMDEMILQATPWTEHISMYPSPLAQLN